MSTFEGAADSVYTKYWEVAGLMTPDYELDQGSSLKKLRLRSRQLIKDGGVPAGIQQAYINFIAGGEIAVKSNSTSPRQVKQIKEFLKIQLNKLDMTGTESLNGFVEQVIGAAFQDGDVLINLPLDNKRKNVKTVVEVIEANRIETPADKESTRRGVYKSNVRHGVQYDDEGRIQGYWVRKANHDTLSRTSLDAFDFYPMYREFDGIRRRVTWLFKAPLYTRPNASRQYPVMTPIITLFKYIKDYKEAVLIGARVAACFSAFVKTSNPAGSYKTMTSVGGATQTNAERTVRVTKLQPGTITYLKDNEDIQFAAPNRPGDNVDPFILRLYKTIAAYMRIPYEILFLDLSETNYSSWRGGVIEAYKMVGRWRRELGRIIEWAVSTLVFEAMLNGDIIGSLDDAHLVIRWPAKGLLDPEKEARANKLRLQNNTTTKRRIAEEEGEDYDELLIEREKEEIEELELIAKKLKKKKELEEKHGILIADEDEGSVDLGPDNRNTSNSRRKGEAEGEDLDPDDAKERRKSDGNW